MLIEFWVLGAWQRKTGGILQNCLHEGACSSMNSEDPGHWICPSAAFDDAESFKFRRLMDPSFDFEKPPEFRLLIGSNKINFFIYLICKCKSTFNDFSHNYEHKMILILN